MTQPVRLSASETRQRVSAGSALLVCAYDDDEKFKNNHLQGAIPLSEFKSKLPSLPQDQEFIFYCA
jgi:rhodanese-related sulfurtransferase